MTKKTSLIATLALAAVPMVAALACSHNDGSADPSTNPGPVQRAGAHVDEAGHDVKEGAKSAASAVGSTTEKAVERVQGKQ
jgi:hypothetical protein